jgi:serine phosphatase RsbU (regulator of sigma subunit)/PAS domain-containing protein
VSNDRLDAPEPAGIVGIHQLLVALSAAVTRAEVVEVFLTQARELVGADAAAVAMASADGRSLSMLGMAGFEPELVERFQEFSADSPTMMSDAWTTGEPVFAESEAEAHERYPHLAQTGRALAAVPARGRNGFIGVVAFRFPGRRAFDQSLRALILTIGQHLGLALDRADLFETAEAERRRLAALMEQLPVGVAIAEAPSGRIIAANDQATTIWRSRPFSEPITDISGYVAFHPDGRRYGPEDWPIARSLATGEVVDAADVNVEFHDGTRGWVSISARPITGRQGQVVGAVTTLVDVTDRRRREAEARFVAEAADVLAGSLDPDEILHRLASLAVPRLADWCAVYVPDGDGIRTVVVAHSDPAKVALAEEFAARYENELDSGGLSRVIEMGESQLTPLISREMIEAVAPDPDFTRVIFEELGLRSVLTVPLWARGDCLGALRLVAGTESGRRFDDEALAFAEDLATHAALAVSNARLFAQQADIADTLQRSLLPIKLPEIPGLEIATAYQPAGAGVLVGGDFYDVWQIGDEGSFGLAIGDVAGKGAPAAALTALARHTARTASLTLPSHGPAEVLGAVNDGILRRAGSGRLCTLATVYGRPDGNGFELITACGGHPLPLILRRDGTVEQAGVPGTLLGLIPDIQVPETRVHLASGDLLLTWTDGLEDHRRSGEFFGEQRIVDLLAGGSTFSAHDHIARILDAVLGFSPIPPRDDIALIAVKAL